MDYTEEFEEYEDESSDDGGDQLDRILVPKLPVADFDHYDPSQPPISGEDYLRRVQLEAQCCPEVVVADLDLAKFKPNQTLLIEESNGFYAAKPELKPSIEWQREQVSDFTNVRLKMARMKELRVRCGLTDDKPFFRHKSMVWWKEFCTGHKGDSSGSGTESITDSDLSTPNGTPQSESVLQKPKKTKPKPEPNLPYLSIMCDMTQDEVIRVLSYHEKWLKQFGFSEDNGRWIYALLVALEKPLPSEVYSILRDLSRVCSECRLKVESTSNRSTLNAINLIICLIGRYFEQNDMCDD